MTNPTPTPPGRLPDVKGLTTLNTSTGVRLLRVSGSYPVDPDMPHMVRIRPYIVGEDNRTDPERTLDEAVGLLRQIRSCIPPDRLRLLAEWLDFKDSEDGRDSKRNEVQQDLRRLADLLAQLPEAHDEQQ